MSQNFISSTQNDDEHLLDQLRQYGEPNLPLLPSQATSTLKRSKKTGSSKSNYLNDSNRDIYIKKLNHYRARAKIENNPSREYLKTTKNTPVDLKRISNIYKIEDTEYDDDEDQADNDVEIIGGQEEDIIELDRTEYIQVVNGATSPLSMSDYDPNTSDRFDEQDDYEPKFLSSTRGPSMGGSQFRGSGSQQVKSPEQQKQAYGYVKLKDRIELDETLSKYRNDIENILHQSVRRNRLTEGSAASKYLNDDVLDNYKKSADSKKIMYCPKPEPTEIGDDNANTTFFGRIFSRNNNKNVKPVKLDKIKVEENEGLRKRREVHKNEQANLPQLPSKAPKTSVLSNIGNILPDAGLKLAKFLPYLVLIVVTLIALQYVHLKFFKSSGMNSSAVDDERIFVEQILDTKAHSAARDAKGPGLYCSDVKDTKCAGTKLILGNLIDFLRTRSGQIDCSTLTHTTKPKTTDQDPSTYTQIPYFSEKSVHLNEIIEFLNVKRHLITNPDQNTDTAIKSVLEAIAKNPHWEVLLLNSDLLEVQEPSQVKYLISLVSSKSYACLLREFAYFVYVRALIFGLAVVALVLGYFCFNLYRKNRAAQDKEYFDLITQVTGMVEKQYELSLLDSVHIKPYIAVSHIYDTLVEPSERAGKKKLWSKVVSFIQDHESRIHLETQFINGEETNVWKWIVAKHESVLVNKYKDSGIGLANSTMITPDATNPNIQQQHQTISANTNAWQGSAFNHTEKLVHSPTPCLKIRNMFDQTDYEKDRLLPYRIHNDILEKCADSTGTNKTILHITCDKKSKEGCVYIKCASNEAAGLAYQCLNGAWYNGKLLNVKFLRSDRYSERFPESIGFSQTAKPIKI